MKCCGKDVETPLCPYCGNPNTGAGPSLLHHINEQVESLQRSNDAWSRDRVEQWKSWRQFVSVAIKAQSEAKCKNPPKLAELHSAGIDITGGEDAADYIRRLRGGT